ncbi:MAG: LysM peptidoglycan-binding domain-containing protein [Ardenticatenaceae bacterium]|nr:LysM peptidoglycan-binding domain-containing protein [Ardenticatenaceae bacterium]
MKRLVLSRWWRPSRWWLPALLLLVLALVACERPINPESTDPTADPILPATLAVPTTDPNAQPTTDPAQATAVPEATTDPATAETAVPAATDVPATSAPRGEVSHTVVAGDTLTGLSVQYNIPVEVIVSANNLTNVDSLDIGQVLTIPAEGTEVVATTEPAVEATAVPPVTTERTHVVQAGENLFRIGLQYGFTVDELASYNNIANPNVLDVGQVIKIPPSN